MSDNTASRQWDQYRSARDEAMAELRATDKDATTVVSAVDLEAIDRRLSGISDGLWETVSEVEESEWGDHEVWGIAGVSEPEEVFDSSPAHVHLSGMTQQDAEFISHARQDVPALMAEVRRLRDINERMLAQHTPLINSTSALHPIPLCSCGTQYPCPTVTAAQSTN